jgi:hypothetical protein
MRRTYEILGNLGECEGKVNGPTEINLKKIRSVGVTGLIGVEM